MAERDRFELDLAAALRAYLEEAPTEVRPTELARQFATAYPHGRAAFGPWRLPTALRPAWVLLLLAGLLVALVAGTLLVGSQLQRRLPAVVPPAATCPPGSNPDKRGPVDQARPADEYTATAFDRRAGRLVVITNKWLELTEDTGQGVETWTFDVCTNTWTQMHPNREPPGFRHIARLVYDVDSDVTIAWLVVSYGDPGVLLDPQTGTWTGPGGDGPAEMWAYDLQTDTWTKKKAPPADLWSAFLAYDPVSGLVVAAPYSEPEQTWWNYEVETDTWTPIHQANAGPSEGAVIAYDASVDRLVAYGDGPDIGAEYETWLFDLRSGTWSRSGAQRPPVWGWLTAPRLVYDEAAKRSVVLMRYPETTYDATADRWETLAEADDTWPYPAWMVYDPLNRRLVGLGGKSPNPDIDVVPVGVEALDLVTGERTVLLERVGGQAAP